MKLLIFAFCESLHFAAFQRIIWFLCYFIFFCNFSTFLLMQRENYFWFLPQTASSSLLHRLCWRVSWVYWVGAQGKAFCLCEQIIGCWRRGRKELSVSYKYVSGLANLGYIFSHNFTPQSIKFTSNPVYVETKKFVWHLRLIFLVSLHNFLTISEHSCKILRKTCCTTYVINICLKVSSKVTCHLLISITCLVRAAGTRNWLNESTPSDYPSAEQKRGPPRTKGSTFLREIEQIILLMI